MGFPIKSCSHGWLQFSGQGVQGSLGGISGNRMRNNPIIVQKYGGACLETPAKIRAVAGNLADPHRRVSSGRSDRFSDGKDHR
jgi:hypothetical protein